MLSILIPTYNYNIKPLVIHLCDELCKLNGAYEIIVLNDGADTSGLELSENSAKKIRILNNETNLGRTMSRQKLAENAIYDRLLFLDADVIPRDPNFINRYLNALSENPDIHVFFGGYSYDIQTPGPGNLRWLFGKKREEIKAEIRNKMPYKVIISGNMLISRELFFTCNTQFQHRYGLDMFFSSQLKQNKASVLHINNPVIHLGIDDNAIFLDKTRQAIATLHTLYATERLGEHQITLLKYSEAFIKSGLKKPIVWLFKLLRKPLEKNLLSQRPSLRYFDLYKLGYFLSLTNPVSHA